LNVFSQGLALSGIGILITFSSIGLLILIILGLKSIFPGEVRKKESPTLDPSQTSEELSVRERMRKAAAAAAVVELFQQKRESQSSTLGKTLERPPGNWWRNALNRNQSKEGG
jgi:hypothetical protein